MFSTNVTGLINMTQAILPIYKARSDGGRGDIINIGSIAGREPYQGGSIYCATKAAVRSFTEALRKELIATRIRVIEIDPGQVETEFSVVRFYGDKEKAKKVYEGVEPLTGDDIAEVVVFAAGRRENVVLADTLVYPNHQVSCAGPYHRALLMLRRQRQRSCIGRRRNRLTAHRRELEATTCIESLRCRRKSRSCRRGKRVSHASFQIRRSTLQCIQPAIHHLSQTLPNHSSKSPTSASPFSKAGKCPPTSCLLYHASLPLLSAHFLGHGIISYGK